MNISKALSSRHFFKNLTLTLFILFCNQAAATIYKWVDAEGNVHYGQQRPTDAQAEKMDIQRYAPDNSSTYKRPGSKTANTEDAAANEAQANKQPDDANKDAKKPETKEEKKRRLAACASARKNLATMQSIGRIRSKDENGNLTYMSQEQKEAKMKQLNDMVKQHCK